MVFYSFYYLVVFMSFSGNEDDISALRERAGCLNSGSPVFDDKSGAQFLCAEAIGHIFEDSCRLFVTRVV